MNTTSTPTRQKVLRLLEWGLSIFGAAVCLAVAIIFAGQQLDNLWPTPGFYFIEITLLGLLVVASRVGDKQPAGSFWGAVPWGAAGALFPIVILGALSIGFFLLPAMLAFLAVGIISDLRWKRSMGTHFGVAMTAVLGQAILIFAILSVVRR